MLAQGRFAAISRVPFTGLKLRGRRIPFWLMTCSLVIAGSIGLCFFQYFNAMAATDAIEEAYRPITAGEPIVRSSFDGSLIENELAYVTSPCGTLDTRAGRSAAASPQKPPPITATWGREAPAIVRLLIDANFRFPEVV